MDEYKFLQKYAVRNRNILRWRRHGLTYRQIQEKIGDITIERLRQIINRLEENEQSKRRTKKIVVRTTSAEFGGKVYYIIHSVVHP